MAAGPAVPVFFSPDTDPSWDTTPGQLTLCTNFSPTKRNSYINRYCGSSQAYKSWNGAVATYKTPLIGYLLKQLDGTARFIVGTAGKLIELSGSSTITDRSAGGAYDTSTFFWTMTSFGNDIIACNYKNNTQISTGTSFADLTGAPKASLCCTQMGFVVLADYDNTSAGGSSYSDGWWCSALFNDASWTPLIATQAANGRLLDTPGQIRALVPLGDSIVAYKADSIYVGEYVGPPYVWGWRVVSRNVGAFSVHGVAEHAGVHYFLHKTGVYAFDGQTLRNLNCPALKFFLTSVADLGKLNTIQTEVDEIEGIITFYARNSADASATSLLSVGLQYNIYTGKWSYLARPLWHDTASIYCTVRGTRGDLLAFDSTALIGNSNLTIGTGNAGTNFSVRSPALLGQVLSTDGQPSMTMGAVGRFPNVPTLSRIIPRFLQYAGELATPTCSVLQRRLESFGALSTSFTWNANEYSFDGTVANRYLYPTLTFQASVEIPGIALDVKAGPQQ